MTASDTTDLDVDYKTIQTLKDQVYRLEERS
jgi:hypothetical protein